jgi:hypothetical protein
MFKIVDYPLLVFAAAFPFLSFCIWIGARVLRRWSRPEESTRDNFSIVVGATLTLLGLLVGFGFSMAVGRYDQRKNLEEAEANAIGTEYLRAQLLPAADAEKVRALLRDYFDQRILFYTSRDFDQLREVDARTATLQAELWSAVVAPAAAAPLSPSVALAVSGMNDVLNAQGYTQAAWWNRIPRAAWLLMLGIAACCHLLVGYGVRDAHAERSQLLVLPLVLAIAFFLIADIDSPRGGVIRVSPQNLLSVGDSMRPPDKK